MTLDSYFGERVEIADLLARAGEPSLLNVYQTDLPKVLVLVVASRFESDVVSHIEEFFTATSKHETAPFFVKKKALTRQYHQLFDWDRNTATRFINFFGPACEKNFTAMSQEHEWLDKSVADFLLLGRTRNQLVHSDIASYSMTLTPDEVKDGYISATRFVQSIPHIIRAEPLPRVEDESG